MHHRATSTKGAFRLRLNAPYAVWVLAASCALITGCSTVSDGAKSAPARQASASTLSLPDAAMNRDFDRVRQLLQEKEKPALAALASDGTPALHWAIRYENAEAVKLLISAGADPNQKSRYDLTPLQVAIENDDADMVRLLLKAGADAKARIPTGETILMAAAARGEPNVAKALIEAGAVVDAKEDSTQQTALMIAVREGATGTVRELIAAGADVNAQTRTGRAPASRMPADNSGSKGLGIVRGGWPEDRGMRNPVPGAKTPLIYAAREGRLEEAKLLVAAGAKLEATDANQMTPLLTAIINNKLDVARYLVEAGANVNAADWYGETPLWAAVDARNLDVNGPNGPGMTNGVDRAKALDFIEFLLKRGANVNARVKEYPPERRFITGLGSLAWVDVTGQTPFFRAAYAGDVTVMKLLLAHGADPKIGAYAGTTPLMAAAGVNWVQNQTYTEGLDAALEAVKLCYDLGVDVNATNSMGLQAIHGAANRGLDSVIAFLASKGADLEKADNYKRTPITWAEGVFLATNAPEAKPSSIALLNKLIAERKTKGEQIKGGKLVKAKAG
jgi:uncharacterized protein